MSVTKFAAATALVSLFAAMPAKADMIAALVGNDQIAMIDSDSRRVTSTIRISGLTTPVVAIDVRPSDGMLYALATDGTVVTVNTTSGAATIKARLETMITSGVGVAAKFNPVADRLRIVGADGMNLRANVDDGKVAVDGRIRFADNDTNAARTAAVVALGYLNQFRGARETGLVDIDRSGVFARQAPPNDGILVSIGATGTTGNVAFDVAADGNGGNTGWLVAGGTLHRVDVTNGRISATGAISGLPSAVRDIAVLPRS